MEKFKIFETALDPSMGYYNIPLNEQTVKLYTTITVILIKSDFISNLPNLFSHPSQGHSNSGGKNSLPGQTQSTGTGKCSISTFVLLDCIYSRGGVIDKSNDKIIKKRQKVKNTERRQRRSEMRK